MTREFTQQELTAFQQALDALGKNGLDIDYEGSGRNADLLMKYFEQTSVTVAAIYQVVEQHKNEFAWLSPARQTWNKESVPLSPADRDRILNYVRSSKNLKSDGDNLFVNAIALVQWLVSHGYSAASANLDVTLSQVAAQSRYPLVKATRPQDSEKAAQATKEAAAKQQIPKHTNDDVPSYVPAHLVEHYRQNQQAIKAKQATAPVVTPQQKMSHYEQLTRDAIAAIRSNVDRAEASAKFLHNPGGNWEFTWRQVRIWSERRAAQRVEAGR